MDLVTDKCIEDKIELNYYVEETNRTEWEIQNYTTYREKVADGIKKIPKHRKKNKPLETDGDRCSIDLFFDNRSPYS